MLAPHGVTNISLDYDRKSVRWTLVDSDLIWSRFWWVNEKNMRLHNVRLHVSNRMVESSSRWISESNNTLSSKLTWLRQHRTSLRLSGRRRSGSTRDICRTTKHLCTSPRMHLARHHCPGLECWICVRVDVSVSHLKHTFRQWRRCHDRLCKMRIIISVGASFRRYG